VNGVTIKILLADDHKIMRDGLRKILQEQSDMEVIGEANSGRAAVDLAYRLVPDVIIMDISMPVMNGIEATRRIVAKAPQIKIIALSMHSDKRYVVEMLKAGALGYVHKMCQYEDLAIAIRAVIAQKSYFCPRELKTIGTEYIQTRSKRQLSVFSVLTSREREVLQLVAEGKTTRQIASTLNVSIKTIETHRQQIMKKLGINSIAELTKYAIREGLTSLEG
jgi:two-component system, NarL family, response regulator NreC